MRKSVFWAGLFMLAALLLRLFAPLAPDPVVRDAFVSLFAGAGLLFAGFAFCETGPLAAAREALDFEAKAHLEREEYRNGRIRRLESARQHDLAQLDNALLQAATLEDRNKTLEDNSKALFARVERAERANANLRAEVRGIAKDRDVYGAAVGVLGRVLDGCRFVGDPACAKYMGLIVRECREKYRNPRLGDEEKRAMLSVEIQAGALLRLAPPGKGGAAFTVESVPLVADGPAPHNPDIEAHSKASAAFVRECADNWGRDFNASFVEYSRHFQPAMSKVSVGDLVTLRSLEAFIAPSPADIVDFLGLTYEVVGLEADGYPLIRPRSMPGVVARPAWPGLLDVCGRAEPAPAPDAPLRVNDRVVFKSPANPARPRVWIVTGFCGNGEVSLSAEDDRGHCILAGSVDELTRAPAANFVERRTSDMAWPQVKDVVEFLCSHVPGAPVPQGQYIVTTAYNDGTVDVATPCGVAGFSKVPTLVLRKPKDALRLVDRVKFIKGTGPGDWSTEVFNVTRLNSDGTVDLVSDSGTIAWRISRSQLVSA